MDVWLGKGLPSIFHSGGSCSALRVSSILRMSVRKPSSHVTSSLAIPGHCAPCPVKMNTRSLGAALIGATSGSCMGLSLFTKRKVRHGKCVRLFARVYATSWMSGEWASMYCFRSLVLCPTAVGLAAETKRRWTSVSCLSKHRVRPLGSQYDRAESNIAFLV